MEKHMFFELVKKAQRGDQEAFAALCKEKSRDVLYFATSLMGNIHDGEDAAQEIFIQLQKNIKQLKNPELFHVWFHKIMIRTCSHLRNKRMKTKNNVTIEDYENITREENRNFLPAEFVEDAEKKAYLLAVIRELPSRYRTCVLLYYYEEMSYAEIAETMGISTKAVENSLRRAKQTIKKKLAAKFDSSLLMGGFLPVPVLGQVLSSDAMELFPPDTIQKFLDGLKVLGGTAVAGSSAYAAVGTAARVVSEKAVHIIKASLVAAGVGAAIVAVGLYLNSTNKDIPPNLPAVVAAVSEPGSTQVQPKASESPQSEGLLPEAIPTTSTMPRITKTPEIPTEQDEADDAQEDTAAAPSPSQSPIPTPSAVPDNGVLSGGFFLDTAEQQSGVSLAGIELQLYKSPDFSRVYKTTFTQADGSYTFSNLPHDTYQIKVILPQNMMFTKLGTVIELIDNGTVAWLKKDESIQFVLGGSSGTELLDLKVAVLAGTTVSGKVQFVGVDGAVIPAAQKYAAGCVVTLTDPRNKVLAQETLNQTGIYHFDPLFITSTEQYILRLSVPGSKGLAFAAANASGELHTTIRPVQGALTATDFYITDNVPPTGSIKLHSKDCACGHENPYRAEITFSDNTEATQQWQITEKNSGVVVAQGTSTVITQELLDLPVGIYELKSTITDIAGNTITVAAIRPIDKNK